MALTNDLKLIYSSAPINKPLYTALVLTNPMWPAPLYLIDNTAVPRIFDFDGAAVKFLPTQFSVEAPDRRDDSLPELQLSFTNYGNALVNLLEQASLSGEPITLKMTQYSDDANTPGLWPPLELQFTSVALDEENCTGTARRVDLINRAFPREVFTIENYPGLFR